MFSALEWPCLGSIERGVVRIENRHVHWQGIEATQELIEEGGVFVVVYRRVEHGQMAHTSRECSVEGLPMIRELI